jgi:hypothetical protein
VAQGSLTKTDILVVLAELRQGRAHETAAEAFVAFAGLVSDFIGSLDGEVCRAMTDKQIATKHSLMMICKK